jgi:hypothetical protein
MQDKWQFFFPCPINGVNVGQLTFMRTRIDSFGKRIYPYPNWNFLKPIYLYLDDSIKINIPTQYKGITFTWTRTIRLNNLVFDLGFHTLIIGCKVEAPKVIRISILSKLNFNLILHAFFS